MIEPPDLSRYVRNPWLRAELAAAIEEYVEDTLVAVFGGGVAPDDVPRSVVVGLAERCFRQSELLSRRAEKA